MVKALHAIRHACDYNEPWTRDLYKTKHTQYGMVHGDIKPNNILINFRNGDLNFKLADYGTTIQLVESVAVGSGLEMAQ